MLFLLACIPSEVLDADNDGHNSLASGGGDCDDDNPLVHPNVAEECGDGIDNNCDGAIDNNGIGANNYYADVDGDGHGAAGDGVSACVNPDGYVTVSDDCDDTRADVHPGLGDDSCDGVDNDCDGEIDQDASWATWYYDADGDGYGIDTDTQSLCTGVDHYVQLNGDCDDSRIEVHPGATELCDALDNDCDGTVDVEVYGDGEICAAETCDDLCDVRERDGRFWITGTTSDAFEVNCDCTRAGGGWTEITGELAEAQGWTTFTRTGGTGGWDAGWSSTADGSFELIPQAEYDYSRNECTTVAVRASISLPWTFSEWFGQWRAAGVDAFNRADDDITSRGWGEAPKQALTASCPGSLLFGTDQVTTKSGADWGTSWTDGGARTFVFPTSDLYETAGTSTKIRFEVADDYWPLSTQGGWTSGVELYDVEIWIRNP
jgi:hypothetical protein